MEERKLYFMPALFPIDRKAEKSDTTYTASARFAARTWAGPFAAAPANSQALAAANRATAALAVEGLAAELENTSFAEFAARAQPTALAAGAAATVASVANAAFAAPQAAVAFCAANRANTMMHNIPVR